MYTLNRLMVGLDLTPMDDTLIPYAAFLCGKLQIEKIYFIHIVRTLDLPHELMQTLEREHMPADEHFRSMIEQRVYPEFKGINTEVEVIVREGRPLKELLHWKKVKQVDLMLVGRKLRLRGSGVLAQKLVRTSGTSVLFVPENMAPRLKRIMVSVDFSEYSEMALNNVLHSALNKPEMEVYCLHIYQVPTGYRTLGMSYEAFDEKMREFAYQKYEHLLSKFPELRNRAKLVLVRQQHEGDIGQLVAVEAKRARADMLVIGAKGLTAAALFVLGSVTEKVLRFDMDIPLLVFKRKNKEMGLLDALINS